MYWPILILSAELEAVWATALGYSDGFSVFVPTLVFFVALAGSMAGLAYAMRGIPLGTAYAIWTGLGAALTVTYAIVFGGESASVAKVLFLAGIIGCVVGLKLVHSHEETVAAEVGAMPPPDEPPGA
ncbi:multidrug efflux SMR transporter [Agromyces sp. SYSU K20354]|uniref:DMT family transporter n=1 Tax=Agromyces cavernae TaxID=2898659 RepID=UPI001E55668D|nr:multidrug efflux SMR transporter [Agromyces cavernae]MCD2442556.1 multidrug efflux SMR transporter [Agromyces cavernae]